MNLTEPQQQMLDDAKRAPYPLTRDLKQMPPRVTASAMLKACLLILCAQPELLDAVPEFTVGNNVDVTILPDLWTPMCDRWPGFSLWGNTSGTMSDWATANAVLLYRAGVRLIDVL